MKSLAPHDPAREKLDRRGSSVLGDNEPSAVILSHGFSLEDALEIANRVLSLSGGVHGLTRMTEGRLRRISGVEPAKSAQILAAVELGRRAFARALSDRPRLGNPCDGASYLLPGYGSEPVE